MGTSTPGNKRHFTISEVACPDSCNQPEPERGCHFRMGPDRFTCTKCHLRIWRHFMGYELNPTDLQEMLHGDKITSTEKVLTWTKDGQETTIRGRLVFTEEYKVRIAPKLKSKQPTDEACPKCKTGKLQLITAIDNSRWYGCSGYPKCRFTKRFVPHRFKTTPTTTDSRVAKDNNDEDEAVPRNRDSGGGKSHSATLLMTDSSSREQPASVPENPANSDSKAAVGATASEQPASSPRSAATPAALISDASDGARTRTSAPDRYQRIPEFIKKMLKLDKEPSVETSNPPSLS